MSVPDDSAMARKPVALIERHGRVLERDAQRHGAMAAATRDRAARRGGTRRCRVRGARAAPRSRAPASSDRRSRSRSRGRARAAARRRPDPRRSRRRRRARHRRRSGPSPRRSRRSPGDTRVVRRRRRIAGAHEDRQPQVVPQQRRVRRLEWPDPNAHPAQILQSLPEDTPGASGASGSVTGTRGRRGKRRLWRRCRRSSRGRRSNGPISCDSRSSLRVSRCPTPG